MRARDRESKTTEIDESTLIGRKEGWHDVPEFPEDLIRRMGQGAGTLTDTDRAAMFEGLDSPK